MHLVMFDIDGTLTATDEADTACYVEALREVFGFSEVDTDWSHYPHCSDSGILETIFQSQLGRSPKVEEVAAMQSKFVSLLSAAVASEPFRQIRGAQAILEALHADPNTAVSLASGAWECSARLKLESAGLPRGDIPTAFSDDAPARVDIMRKSLERALQSCGCGSFDSVTYVGDGVWDARASHELGWPFIGIAREPGRMQRLRDEGAVHVFPDFSEAAKFFVVLRNCQVRLQA